MKVVRKKKKKIRLATLSAVSLVLSCLMWISSSLFLRTYNNHLSSKIQNIQSETKQLEIENDANRIEINTLSNKERIESISNENGLRYNVDNIIIIEQGENIK